jgi:hypothetical protein
MIATGDADDDNLQDKGDRARDRAARRSRDRSSAVAEIGTIPPVANPERRAKCEASLLEFLQTYFPNSTGLSPFSEDHQRVIARIERCIRHGGRFLNVVYRGFAKTTISQLAALWAVLGGHRRYVVVFGANDGAAERNIASIKLELSDNDLLLEDFPEVCHAVRALEGKAQRCHSQTHDGELTHIQWKAGVIVLPTIKGSKASGAILASRGLTAATRGLVVKGPDGTNQRPDFALVDDPQTDESARHPNQVRKLLDIIKKAILRSGGHNKQVACVVNATVIAKQDLVEQLFDRKRNPSWQGERIKMVRKWANLHDEFWLDKYAKLLTTFSADDPDGPATARAEATALYEAHRAEADAGCIVSWEHCYSTEDGEISAIQHAYNILILDGPDVFASECQNEPRDEAGGVVDLLTIDQVLAKLNGYRRREIPADCQFVTAFIDVGGRLLHWMVVAWADDFTGYIVDYGVFPEQAEDYVVSDHAHPWLGSLYPNADLAGQLNAALEALTNGPQGILSREWARDDGALLRVGKCFIDANWSESTPIVRSFCRQSAHSAILMPSHGQGLGANKKAFEAFDKRDGWRLGLGWAIPPTKGKARPHLLFDTNYWKSFVHDRFRVPLGSRGALSLFAGPQDHEKRDAAARHRMIAEHITAETPHRKVGLRTVNEWTQLPARENHLLDCLVGCAVGAETLGAKVPSIVKQEEKRRSVSVKDIKAKRASRRGRR